MGRTPSVRTSHEEKEMKNTEQHINATIGSGILLVGALSLLPILYMWFVEDEPLGMLITATIYMTFSLIIRAQEK
jgi:hypothetical protein